MILKRILFSLLFINCVILNAQVISGNSYHLSSTGIFPNAIINDLQAQINSELQERSSYKTSVPQKQKLDTLIYNDIFLHNMLLCGEVLYGDSISLYVNNVGNELLKNDPEALKRIHFFVIRSATVETYYFDKGFIFITTGLIAQLENEAQLAFILSHEIAHYKLEHSTILKLQDELELYKRNQYTFSQLFSLLKKPFSQKEEMDADNFAVEIIKKSDYSLTSIDQAFDLLQYKFLPFDDMTFDRSFFENADLKLSDTLFLKNITPITSYDNKTEHSEEEALIHIRRGVLESSYNIKETGKRKYILPKQLFMRAREEARFLFCEDYLTNRDYINAIYAAYILSKKYPDNNYLGTIVSKAFYAISIVKTSGHRNTVPVYLNIPDVYHPAAFESNVDLDYKLKEGNSQALYYFFDQIEPLELNVMAISYVWKTYKKTGNKELKNITDSLFSELFISNKMKGTSFSRYTKEELRTQDSLGSGVSVTESSKYDKIKSLQVKNDINSTENGLKFTFVNNFKDEEFSKMFDRNLLASRRRSQMEKTKIDLSLKKVAIAKVVIVEPYFTCYPSRFESIKKDIEKCEFQERKYIALLTSEMKKNKIEFQLISENDSLLENDAYNDRSSIHNWIIEREKNGSNPDAIVLRTEHCQELAIKYGTPFFIFCGIKTISDSHGQRTVHVFKVFNILTGELVQFNVEIEGYIGSAQDMSMDITYCVKELAKNCAK